MKIKYNQEVSNARLAAYARQYPEEELPDDFFRTLMDDQLGRGYLNHMAPAENWEMEPAGLRGDFGWLRFSRLPIRPGKEEENTILESWQSVLSACHTMGLRVAFVLLRRKGNTQIYLGAAAPAGKSGIAAEQLRQCMSIHMPGAEFLEPKNSGILEETLENFTHSGLVTGIPSLRGERSGVTLQTLDKLARGVRVGGSEKDYALVILADPASDAEITRLQQTFLDLKSEIHQFVKHSTHEGFQEGGSQQKGSSTDIDLSVILSGVLEGLSLAFLFTGNVAGYAGAKGLATLAGVRHSRNKNRGQNYGTSSTVTREYQNFIATYCEDLIDKNIARLEGGRNLGFWQTGIYVLSEDDVVTDSVLGILRSVYSGKESYVEPIRVINAGGNSAVSEYVGRLQFLPLPGKAAEKKELGKELGLHAGWHILGRMYESFTTALTTEELSIASSLPRREVPGLRMVKNNISFANNTAIPAKDAIELGRLVDVGVPQETRYRIDPNALVRHILVCGSTGSGKSTTCKKIINGVAQKDIPVMIIEPAKDDYVRWAIEQNKTLPKEKRYTIIMPGASKIDGVQPEPLQLNMLQPAAWGKDTSVNLVQRAETLATLLNVCLPSEDVIPILLEETVHQCLQDYVEKYGIGIDLTLADNPQMKMYPTLWDLQDAGNIVIDRKTYENRVKEGYREILNTRFSYLLRGTRGKILHTAISTDYDKLFNRPVVINLSRLAGSKDKSLIMSLLLLALQEYRISRYTYDEAYRARAQQNELMHLVVIEEAHNVLTKPSPMTTSGDPQQAAAELFGNMLSEIRSYGQGMMIVDQVPTRLIEDALKNTNYKIAHRMTAPDDIDVMSTAMILRKEQAEVIPSLEIGNAIICGDMDDAAAWVRVECG